MQTPSAIRRTRIEVSGQSVQGAEELLGGWPIVREWLWHIADWHIGGHNKCIGPSIEFESDWSTGGV